MNWWLLIYYDSGGTVLIVSWVFWVFFSIVMHELAHGWAALWQGDDTPRTLGHMTWNPLVHMPPMAILMFIVVGITWGLMPVDPSKFKWRRKGRIVVAGAGPAMNLLLFTACITAYVLWITYGVRTETHVYLNVGTFLWSGAILNIVLAAFNLLPLPPLDGSNILSGLSLKWYILMHHPNAQPIGFFILLVVFFSGLTILFWEFGLAVTGAVSEFLFTMLPITPGIEIPHDLN